MRHFASGPSDRRGGIGPRRRRGAGRRPVAILAGAALAMGTAGALALGAGPADALATSTTSTLVSATSISLGSTVSDTATVQGNPTNGSPTGNVMFFACQTGTSQTLTTGACAAVAGNHVATARLGAAAGNAATASSSMFQPTSAGTWCFSASYAGDSNYGSSADNTTSGNLDANECLLVETENPLLSSVTAPPNITLGPSGSVSDSATVSGNPTGGKPTGTVVFYVCQTGTTQTQTDGPCPATGTPEDAGESLVTGSDDVSTAASSSFTPTSAGTWCFSSVYEGDTNYSAQQDNTSSGNLDANECVFVATATAGEASEVSSGTITLGPAGSVSDSVTLTGNSVGGSPTGTVSFYACRTGTGQTLTTGPCPATGTPEDASETLGAGAGDTATASSMSFMPDAGGTWCFSVTYGGDSSYSAGSDNTSSGNLDAGECVLVTVSGSTTSTAISSAHITAGPGGSVTDTVTVTGNATEGPPTGTVRFYVCGPGSADALCPSTAAAEGSPTLGAAGSASATARSASFSPTAGGVYCFAAVYVPAGNADYTGSSDNQAGPIDAHECVSVAPQPYTFTSANHVTATAGKNLQFTVRTAGSPIPKIKKKGSLPKKVKLVNNHNGTATLMGIPSIKKVGTYNVTLTATFGKGKAKHVATQVFTLKVVS